MNADSNKLPIRVHLRSSAAILFFVLTEPRPSGSGQALLALQIPQQFVKLPLIRVVILPVAEIGNVKLANFSRRVLTHVRVEVLPIAQRVEVNKPNWKQHAPLFS